MTIPKCVVFGNDKSPLKKVIVVGTKVGKKQRKDTFGFFRRKLPY